MAESELVVLKKFGGDLKIQLRLKTIYIYLAAPRPTLGQY